MEKAKVKKTIDNHMYCHKIDVYLEEDDYAILDKYREWSDCTLDDAVSSMFAYTMRIVRNIMKYHKDYTNLPDLIVYIAKEANIDLDSIKRNTKLYDLLLSKCEKLCESRCEYMPYERSYWYDILLELMQTSLLIKKQNPNNAIN